MIATAQPTETMPFEHLTSEAYQAMLEKLQRLQQENDLLKQQLFGASSERLKRVLGNRPLLPGMEDLLDAPEDSSEVNNEAETVAGYARKKKRKGHGREKIPDHWPRVVREHFPDGLTAEQIEADPDLTIVGQAVSEEAAYEPPKFYVIKHIRYKIASRSKPEAGVQIAPPATKAIPKGKAHSSLLAHVATEKYLYHQPLHRQKQRFKRMGAHLPRSTLCGWMLALSRQFLAIHGYMQKQLLGSPYLHTDETPVRMLLPEGGSCKSRVWVYAGAATKPYVVYLFSEDREARHVEAYLRDYKGSVHCDAYSGYDFLFKKATAGTFDCLEVACWSHARRYFVRAQQAGERRAWEILTLIGLLFKVERQADALELSGAKRKTFRQRFAPGILADIRAWLDSTGARALPKSQTGKGVTYLNNQWVALNRYLEDGALSLTNNYAERLLRLIAVGRKNWKFFAAESGGKAAVVLYSVVQSCLLNEVDPWLYMTDVLTKLDTHSAAELVPHAWKQRFEAEARQSYLPLTGPYAPH